jgi:hypothetical protein
MLVRSGLENGTAISAAASEQRCLSWPIFVAAIAILPHATGDDGERSVGERALQSGRHSRYCHALS